MQFNELYFYTINDDYLLKIERFKESVQNGYYTMNQFAVAVNQIKTAKSKIENYLRSIDSFQNVVFSSNLTYLDLKGINFSGATFQGNKENTLEISACNMKNVNFSDARFENVKFSGIQLDTPFFYNLVSKYAIDIPEVKKMIPFMYSVYKNANFSNAAFNHCNVSETVFQDCSFAEIGKKTCQFNESIFYNSILLKDNFVNMYSYKMPQFNRCFINDITVRDSVFSDKYKDQLKIYNKDMFDKDCMIYSLNWDNFPILEILSDFQKFTAKLSPKQGECVRNAINLLPLLNKNDVSKENIMSQIADFNSLPTKYINQAVQLAKTFFEKKENTHIINIENAKKYIGILFKCLESSRQTYYNDISKNNINTSKSAKQRNSTSPPINKKATKRRR